MADPCRRNAVVYLAIDQGVGAGRSQSAHDRLDGSWGVLLRNWPWIEGAVVPVDGPGDVGHRFGFAGADHLANGA